MIYLLIVEQAIILLGPYKWIIVPLISTYWIFNLQLDCMTHPPTPLASPLFPTTQDPRPLSSILVELRKGVEFY